MIPSIPDTEKVIAMSRQHWIILARGLAGPLLLTLFLIVGWLTIIFVNPFVPVGLTDGIIFSFVVIPLLLVSWVSLVLTWSNYYLTTLTITETHLYATELRGLFTRHITAINLDNLQEIDVVQDDIWETFFNFGTLTIQTAGPSDVDTTFRGVPSPSNMRTAIMDQIDHFKRLTTTNEQQEQLLHSISHEVKGHLAKSEATLASIVEGDYGEVSPELKKMAGAALSDAQTGVHTVMDILDASNFKKGTLTFSMKPFDLGVTTLSIITTLRPSAEQKGLSLEYTVDGGNHTITGDEQKLAQHVLRNLIDNAIRYTEKGSITVELFHSDKVVQFSVTDTGVGITPEDMAHLFTEGGKGKDSSTVNPASTGYGLFFAQEMVEAHGGKVWAESEGTGKGSRLFVQFPATAV
jgi:signal transduction histidine kinase